MYFLPFFLYCLLTNFVDAKKYNDNQERGFAPSNRYYERDLPLSSNNSRYLPQNPIAAAAASTINTNYYGNEKKESRFGQIGYGPSSSASGNSNGGYGGGGGGVSYGSSAVTKPDIGGVVLGVLLGLGAILIAPKLNSIFSGGYGGAAASLFGRSVENGIGFEDILAKLDNSLKTENLNSGACAQLMLCNLINSNSDKSTDSLSLLKFNGTEWINNKNEGTEHDRPVENCALKFPECTLTKETILNVVSNLL